MRWDNLRIDSTSGSDTPSSDTPSGETSGGATPGTDAARAPGGPPQILPLIERGAVARTFDTPGFRGMTFYEVQAKSIVSRVPDASKVPFCWTINPYRGCQHACSYCLSSETPILMA